MAAPVGESFDVLRTRTAAYTNVTVTFKAADYVMVTHSSGMASIKVQDLTAESQHELGYGRASGRDTESVDKNTAVGAGRDSAKKGVGPLEKARAWLESETGVVALAVAIVFGFYWFQGYCCHRICKKAEMPSPLVWVPVLQLIPLFRVAGMSGWWLLGLFLPLMNIAIHIKWVISISNVERLGRWRWLTIVLLFVPMPILGLAYMAFTEGNSLEPGEVRIAPVRT